MSCKPRGSRESPAYLVRDVVAEAIQRKDAEQLGGEIIAPESVTLVILGGRETGCEKNGG